MKMITRIEEMILLAVLNLNQDAYLISIQNYLSEVSQKKWSLTSVHLPLNRLEKHKYLDSRMGDATAIRGGRRKKIYTVTNSGLEALNEYRDLSNRLWADYLGMETK